MPRRVRMSPVDTAWLRMDRESNLMAIKGVLVLQQPVDVDRLHRVVQERLVDRFPRFRQRVVQDDAGAWWEDDSTFRLNRHLRRRRLPQGPAQLELQRLVSRLATEPLHPARPLWTIDLIPRFEGGSALVVRIHHCIADGMALMGVMLSLTDDAGHQQAAAPASGAAKQQDDPWSALLDSFTRSGTDTLQMGHALWQRYTEAAQDPQAAQRLGRHGAALLLELGKLLLLPDDSATRLKGRTGRRKQVAWSPALSLPEVQAVGQALRCSVNDVLLACVAGALRRHLLAHGDDVDTVEIRAMVPVNMRKRGDVGTLGNRFGMVTLLLPLHVANPVARVQEVARRMGELKRSLLPPLSLGLLGLMGLAPQSVQGAALELLASKATAVMTNVPGPSRHLHLAGSRIEQILFWVPQSGDIGLGVSILSYAQTVQLGLITDEGIVPHPQDITPLFRREFDSLLTALLLHEGTQPLDAARLQRRLTETVAALGL